jgi:hypothetical protein
VKCDLEQSRGKSYVNALLAFAKNPKLQDWVNDTVETVMLCHDAELILTIKEGKWTEWMSKFYEERTSEEPSAEFRKWEQDTGYWFSRSHDRYDVRFEVDSDE